MVPVVFTSAAAGILTWLLCRDEGRKADRIGFALITAGGLSNLYDRLKRGYVVDYFSIRCKYLEKVVFNLGDFFIFAGSALIAASDLLGAVRDLSSPAEAHIKALRLPWRKTDEAE
ncbi:MAG: signal peptidase II [Clostridium fessum]